MFAFVLIGSCLIGVVLGNCLLRLAYRLTEPYKRGTRVRISTFGDDPTFAKYVRRAAFGYHKVEILPGDHLGWDGRLVTVHTKDMKDASHSRSHYGDNDRPEV